MIAQEHAPSYQQHSSSTVRRAPKRFPLALQLLQTRAPPLARGGEAGAAARVAGAAAGRGRADGGAGLLN